MALKAVRNSVKGKGLDYGVLLKISEGRSSLFLTLAYEIRKKWVEMSTLFFFMFNCATPPPQIYIMSLLKSQFPIPVNETLLENRVFAGTIKFTLIRMYLNQT